MGCGVEADAGGGDAAVEDEFGGIWVVPDVEFSDGVGVPGAIGGEAEGATHDDEATHFLRDSRVGEDRCSYVGEGAYGDDREVLSQTVRLVNDELCCTPLIDLHFWLWEDGVHEPRFAVEALRVLHRP